MSYCPECDEDKQSPWYDEYSGLWVHTQNNGRIVICNRINPDPDDDGRDVINTMWYWEML